jgi:hypothetical protein
MEDTNVAAPFPGAAELFVVRIASNLTRLEVDQQLEFGEIFDQRDDAASHLNVDYLTECPR